MNNDGFDFQSVIDFLLDTILGNLLAFFETFFELTIFGRFFSRGDQ